MSARMLAGVIALFGIGLVLSPDAASARRAGVPLGRALHGGPLVRPGMIAPALPAAGAVAPLHAFGIPGFRHRRQQPTSVGGWYGGTSDPVGYAVPYEASPAQGPAANVVPANLIPVQTQGCSGQTKTVPSEAGGVRTITITRCWGAVGAAGG